MKKLIILFTLLVTLVFAGTAGAMGPLMLTPTGLAWDREADSPSTYGTITGYYIYWVATQTPLPAWTNIQRSAVIPQTAVGVTPVTIPITSLNLPNGNWTLCATALTANGESGPSNTVSFLWYPPASPANLKTQ